MLLERLHKRLHASSSKRSQEKKDKVHTPDGAPPVQPEPQHQKQEPQPLLNYDYDDMIVFDRNVSTPVFTPVMTPVNNTGSNQTKHSANSYFPPFLNNNRTRQNSALRWRVPCPISLKVLSNKPFSTVIRKPLPSHLSLSVC